MGWGWFRTLFRVGSGLLCLIESWFIVFPKGLLEGLSTISSKLYLWWLACLLACWLAGWLAGSLACLLACCLARLLSCLLASLPGLLACLPACLLAWPACLPGLLACLLPCWLHCERMIGEKNPGQGEKIPKKNGAP